MFFYKTSQLWNATRSDLIRDYSGCVDLSVNDIQCFVVSATPYFVSRVMWVIKIVESKFPTGSKNESFLYPTSSFGSLVTAVKRVIVEVQWPL